MGSKEIIKKLKKAGFKEVHSKGSHLKMKHPDGRITIVPHPKKGLPLGTIKAIEKQSKVTLT
ncbi:type II toxin-antitoxin system HicA family toxin [Maridesulfovibrio sp.]|uniref:type II toxin-antitoxin system HicA family toxin n=1 Tax=Maridesulfovibrio sp. TaxID=2795000 RepID=UPI0029CA0D0A|nr:type II toxin-antitoxin system HicA family toxin [Maridesulfovibrio sp.]